MFWVKCAHWSKAALFGVFSRGDFNLKQLIKDELVLRGIGKQQIFWGAKVLFFTGNADITDLFFENLTRKKRSFSLITLNKRKGSVL